jgi:potassium channel subfamily K
MPQSLVHEFLDQRAGGNKLRASLKEAIFQAKPPDIELGDVEDAPPKFKLWKVQMRGLQDDDPVDWWFASTGIPILAATLGPLANVLSIGALVTYWRIDLTDTENQGQLLPPLQGNFIKDPTWCYAVNLTSLIIGFIGNLFLLLNFTQRLRYLIALPLTVILWFVACGMLVGDLSAMKVYTPPVAPYEQFSGGFWYGVAAASMYLLLASLLMVNMVGYIRGHYPQHFHLTEEQRTLIVQTMMFFLWLAGGAGVYSRLEKWHYIDAVSSRAISHQ